MNPRPRAISFGEVLFDRIDGVDYLGGAPLNMAWYLAQLQVPVAIVSAVGYDDLGSEVHRTLEATGVIDWVVDSSLPTGITDVQVVDGEPEFQVRTNAAWRHIPPPVGEAADAGSGQGVELIYFGTAAQCPVANRDTLSSLIRGGAKFRLYDANLRPGFDDEEVIIACLEMANAVKLNDAEWYTVSKLAGVSSAAEFLDRFQVDTLAVTKGERGAELHVDGRRYESDATTVDVVDTVGAGDAFCAVLAAGIMDRIEPEHTLSMACRVAAYTVQHRGGQVRLPDPLCDQLHEP